MLPHPRFRAEICDVRADSTIDVNEDSRNLVWAPPYQSGPVRFVYGRIVRLADDQTFRRTKRISGWWSSSALRSGTKRKFTIEKDWSLNPWQIQRSPPRGLFSCRNWGEIRSLSQRSRKIGVSIVGIGSRSAKSGQVLVMFSFRRSDQGSGCSQQ